MASIDEIVAKMKQSPRGVRFNEGKAKPYQVRQVLWALERLERDDGKSS